MTDAFAAFERSVRRCFPRYAPRLALTDGHAASQAALVNTFSPIAIHESRRINCAGSVRKPNSGR
jgi:hypothetical protein